MTAPAARSSLALRRIALFDGMEGACLDRLAQECDWHSMQARKPLFTRDSDNGEVYFLVSGRVRITTYSAQGREVSFRDCLPGEHFGELSAIDGRPRSADAVTLEPSLLASLTPETFQALLRREHIVALRIMRNLAAMVRSLTDRVIDLSTLSCWTWPMRRALRRTARRASTRPPRMWRWPARSAPPASR